MKSNLKRLRKEAGLSSQRLAELIGTYRGNIYRLEQDGCNPTLETACKIAYEIKEEVFTIWEWE